MPKLRTNKLDLTAELVARVERFEPDSGDLEHLTLLSDDALDSLAETIVSGNGAGPLWVFAYGSLIWNPDFRFAERTLCHAHGWRRVFNMGIIRWRATPEQPGLMLALDRGGSCKGVAFRLPSDSAAVELRRLLDRELTYHEELPSLRWLKCRSAGRPFRALAFFANPGHDDFYIDLPIEEQARRLARAAGHIGSGAIYLHNTVRHLEELGIRDRYLWRLQKLVAEEIKSLPPMQRG